MSDSGAAWGIRAAREGDRALLRDVFRMAALASYPELLQLGRLTLAERLLALAELYEGPNKRCFVAASSEGLAMGAVWAVLGIHPVLEGPEALIVAVGVLEAHRGRGVARALLEHAERALRAEGARSIRLFVHSDNVRALRLYQGLGYRQGMIELNLQSN